MAEVLMKPMKTYSVAAILEGRQAAPVMPGPNPWPLWTVEWFAWKEEHENYTPYHMRCSEMPRVREARPGVFKCPSCAAEFPTATIQLGGIQESFRILEHAPEAPMRAAIELFEHLDSYFAKTKDLVVVGEVLHRLDIPTTPKDTLVTLLGLLKPLCQQQEALTPLYLRTVGKLAESLQGVWSEEDIQDAQSALGFNPPAGV